MIQSVLWLLARCTPAIFPSPISLSLSMHHRCGLTISLINNLASWSCLHKTQQLDTWSERHPRSTRSWAIFCERNRVNVLPTPILRQRKLKTISIVCRQSALVQFSPARNRVLRALVAERVTTKNALEQRVRRMNHRIYLANCCKYRKHWELVAYVSKVCGSWKPTVFFS